MATRIGCDNLVYAIQTTEDTKTTPPVYAAPVPAPGVMSININPNASQETLFADDGPMETATTLGKIDVAIQKNELTVQNKADLLGHKIDSKGSIVYSDNDVPPYVAIGFRSLKSNGNYRYVWLYKGKFTDPEDNNETKGDSINFQADTINGQFVKLTSPIDIGTAIVRPWKYELDEDYVSADATLMAAWFTTVPFPLGADAPALIVAYAPGTVEDSTKGTITGAAGSGNHFAYRLLDETPSEVLVGSVITGATTYTSAADIADVTVGDIIGMYELTALNEVVKFAAHTLIADDINPGM